MNCCAHPCSTTAKPKSTVLHRVTYARMSPVSIAPIRCAATYISFPPQPPSQHGVTLKKENDHHRPKRTTQRGKPVRVPSSTGSFLFLPLFTFCPRANLHQQCQPARTMKLFVQHSHAYGSRIPAAMKEGEATFVKTNETKPAQNMRHSM